MCSFADRQLIGSIAIVEWYQSNDHKYFYSEWAGLQRVFTEPHKYHPNLNIAGQYS